MDDVWDSFDEEEPFDRMLRLGSAREDDEHEEEETELCRDSGDE